MEMTLEELQLKTKPYSCDAYEPLDKRIYTDIDYKFNEANLIKEFKDNNKVLFSY